ncbi:MAG: T9SS type A sorting domain-containing protein [Bacteroidales bacterium]|nr:T9SS type A sorting domain-containing protein [Bacteroidales bacterium]MCF8455860.1 T9SS type A sorting domain-containing protein [Bacteroidales bacterium]
MKKIILFSTCIILSNILLSQTVINTYTTLNTGSNGLLDSQVTSFAYGPDGKVWIATKNGFSIYDGSTWTYQNYEDFYPGLDKFVRLFTDSNGNLWVNHTTYQWQGNNLLLKYDGDSIISFGPAQGYYSSNAESNFYEDAEGTIYIQQASTLMAFKNDTFTNINIPVSSVLHCFNLTSDSCGSLVISSANRTYRQGFEGWDEIFSSQSHKIFTTSDKLICLRNGVYLKFLNCNSVVDSIQMPNLPGSNASTTFSMYSNSIEDNQGNIWLYWDCNGLLKYDGQDFTFFNADSLGLATGTFIDELKLNNGKLWFANWLGGIVEWDGNQFNLINTFDGLVENTVKSILVISDSILFGTQNGYSLLNDNTWQSFKYSNAYTNAGSSVDDGFGLQINDMYDLGFDMYVFATSNHGLVVKDTSNYGGYLFLNGFLNPAWLHPQKILKGFNDDYWVAHYLGLAHFFGDSSQWAYTTNYWENFSSVDGLPNDTVYDLCKDNSGNIWCAAQNGIASFQNNTFTVYTTSQGLIDNQTRSIYYDSNGTIWVGTIAGLSKFDGSTWQNFTVADGLAGNQVNSIFEDSQNNMWFGTDQGLSKYKNQAWTNYTTTEGLSHNYINCITEDGEGNLWVGTNFGATKLSISQGIADIDQNNDDFSIFPNPAKNNISISSSSEISIIELYSPTGQLLRKIDSDKKQETIDVSGLAPGNYFIRAIGKEDVWVKKFVKI